MAEAEIESVDFEFIDSTFWDSLQDGALPHLVAWKTSCARLMATQHFVEAFRREPLPRARSGALLSGADDFPLRQLRF